MFFGFSWGGCVMCLFKFLCFPSYFKRINYKRSYNYNFGDDDYIHGVDVPFPSSSSSSSLFWARC